MSDDEPLHWYIVDVYGRSYYGGKDFGSRDEALIAAHAIPRGQRPFGVCIAGNGTRETVYKPVQDM